MLCTRSTVTRDGDSALGFLERQSWREVRHALLYNRRAGRIREYLFPSFTQFVWLTQSFRFRESTSVSWPRRWPKPFNKLRNSPFLGGDSSTAATYFVHCGCSSQNSRPSEDSEDSRWAASPDRPPSSRCRPRRRSCPPSGSRPPVAPGWLPVRRWVGRESPDGTQIDARVDWQSESTVPWGWNRLWAAVAVLKTISLLRVGIDCTERDNILWL